MSLEKPAESVRCGKCGYDLRAHDARSLCPECATPVAETLAELPSAIAPAWLGPIRWGFLFILIGGLSHAGKVPMWLLLTSDATWNFLHLLGSCFSWGVILTTAPEPNHIQPSRTRYLRMTTRALAAVLLFTDISLIGLLAAQMLTVGTNILGIIGLLRTVLTAAAFVYFSMLARRLGRRGLGIECLFMILAIPMTWIVSFLLTIRFSGGFWPLGGGRDISMVEKFWLAVPFFIVGGWFVWLMVRLIRATIIVRPVQSDNPLPDTVSSPDA